MDFTSYLKCIGNNKIVMKFGGFYSWKGTSFYYDFTISTFTNVDLFSYNIINILIILNLKCYDKYFMLYKI